MDTAIVAAIFVLYGVLVAGFTTLWSRLTNIVREQATMPGRLDGIQGQLELINSNFTRIDGEIGRLNGEIGRLDSKIDNRIDRLENRIDRLEDRVDRLDEKIDTLQEEMRRSNEALREEMQRNTDRIIQVLISHSHQDGTPPVFNVPPEAEPVAADN